MEGTSIARRKNRPHTVWRCRPRHHQAWRNGGLPGKLDVLSLGWIWRAARALVPKLSLPSLFQRIWYIAAAYSGRASLRVREKPAAVGEGTLQLAGFGVV